MNVLTDCELCGNPFKKIRDSHKYCKHSCRNKAYRQRNGINEPKFLKNYEKKIIRQPRTIPTKDLAVREPKEEMQLLDAAISYYERTLTDAHKGIFPAYMIGGAAIGLFKKDPIERIGVSLLCGFLGHLMDVTRKENLIKECESHLKRLRYEKRQFKKIKVNLSKINFDSSSSGLYKPAVLNSEDYKRKNVKTIGISKKSKWSYLFGDPQDNFTMLLHGSPGNGKSTFALQFADYFKKNHSDVLFVASEQHGINKSFQDNLNRNVTSNFDILHDKTKQDFEYLSKVIPNYGLVVMDSINSMKLTVEQFEKLRELAPHTGFLTVMQSTKNSNFKGSQEWAHNCDIIVEMRNFTAHQTKSRYAAPSTMLVSLS